MCFPANALFSAGGEATRPAHRRRSFRQEGVRWKTVKHESAGKQKPGGAEGTHRGWGRGRPNRKAKENRGDRALPCPGVAQDARETTSASLAPNNSHESLDGIKISNTPRGVLSLQPRKRRRREDGAAVGQRERGPQRRRCSPQSWPWGAGSSDRAPGARGRGSKAPLALPRQRSGSATEPPSRGSA